MIANVPTSYTYFPLASVGKPWYNGITLSDFVEQEVPT